MTDTLIWQCGVVKFVKRLTGLRCVEAGTRQMGEAQGFLEIKSCEWMRALCGGIHVGGWLVLQISEDVSKRGKALVAPSQQLP